MHRLARRTDQHIRQVSNIEVFTVLNQRLITIETFTDNDPRTTHGSPHQLERVVQWHERHRLADVFHNAPILGRSVAWRVFRAGKGRGYLPLGLSHLQHTTDAANGRDSCPLSRGAAALVAGCGRARIGLGHLGFRPADRAVAIRGMGLAAVKG